MRIQSPSLPELHAFATAARLGSYSQAALELHVTQGGISRAIARLEEHLGFALFERQGRYNRLTADGRHYLDAVGPALFTIESATASLRRRRQGHRLRLSVTPTLFSHWLIPRLPQFTAQHPGTVLSFAPYRRDDPMSDPDIDAWVRIGTADWPASVAADYVVGRDLVPICRPEALHGPQAIRSAEDLLRQPLLAHTNYPDNWARWSQAMGTTTACPTPAADFELVALLVQAVIAGMGVAVVQRCLVEADLAAGRIAVALPQPFQIERGYFLCRPAQREESVALSEFRSWLLEQARTESASLSGASPAPAATAPGP